MTDVLIGHVDIPDNLRVCLKWLHKAASEPEDQSIRHGTQISLSGCRLKAVRQFQRVLGIAVYDLLKTRTVFCGMWSIGMNAGGHHVPHNHPQGWWSGVCYIEVPDMSGLLQIGENMDQFIVPEPGKLVLFPSETPHGTTVYQGTKPRLTVAFDLREARHENEIPMVG